MKIAVLGAENTHIDEIGKIICENPTLYGDIKIAGVYSNEPDAVNRIIKKGYTDYAAQSYDEFVGKVDAAMVIARHGDNHLKYALPYIKAGIPCFIDKPFCANYKDALLLANTAKENGALLCGGSCLKFINETKPLAEVIKSEAVLSASVGTPINAVNPYGAFWFYTQHLIEMITSVFGFDAIKSVIANYPDKNKNRATVIFNCGEYDICGFYTTSNSYYATVVTDKGLYHAQCDNVAYAIKELFDEFVNMVKSGVMPCDYDKLVYPVKILDAIERSFTEKREIKVID